MSVSIRIGRRCAPYKTVICNNCNAKEEMKQEANGSLVVKSPQPLLYLCIVIEGANLRLRARKNFAVCTSKIFYT